LTGPALSEAEWDNRIRQDTSEELANLLYHIFKAFRKIVIPSYRQTFALSYSHRFSVPFRLCAFFSIFLPFLNPNALFPIGIVSFSTVNTLFHPGNVLFPIRNASFPTGNVSFSV